MVLALAFLEFQIILFGGEKGIHTVYFKFQLDVGRKLLDQGIQGSFHIFLGIEGRTDGCK